jgi:adenine-specific DNA methylase
MKYMGSKRLMLANGLGEALQAAVADVDRIVDLFTGSGAVAHHAAERFDCEVIANDLQKFAAALADAVISRTETSAAQDWWPQWQSAALYRASSCLLWTRAQYLQTRLPTLTPEEAAKKARQLCEEAPARSVTLAYGGYYFSPLQALWFDHLRATLPRTRELRVIALAALIQAASKCAASPGHTAQPFKANHTAGRYLIESWLRDVPQTTVDYAIALGQRRSRRQGKSFCTDALALAETVRPGDLVFIDPPYSAVHYSRFYHVLETVARGGTSKVSGEGRYPPARDRPVSEFSVASKSASALRNLIAVIADKSAKAILTFPAEEASNGLSGTRVRKIAQEYFVVEEEKVASRFSTMGGNRKHRAARQDAHELILTLTPRGRLMGNRRRKDTQLPVGLLT